MSEVLVRIESPDRESFQMILAAGKPVIIHGAIKNWRALSEWNAEYLRSVVGTTPVHVEVSPTDYFPPLHANGIGIRTDDQAPRKSVPPKLERHPRKMAFSDFVASIYSVERNAEARHGPSRPLESFYVNERGLIEQFPTLMEDIPDPDWLSKDGRSSSNFWFSRAGAITPLHYDVVDSLFAQVRGRKRFTLFAPEELTLLYPFPSFSRFSHFSRVEILRPDLNTFPKFPGHKAMEFILGPGEILFLPSFWWHQVASLDAAISVSYWWKLSLRRRFAKPALRAVPGEIIYALDRVVNGRPAKQ
jgi:hypothetical protein